MSTLMHAFSRSFSIRSFKGFSAAFIVFALPLFFLVDVLALPNEDTLTQSVVISPQYTNYAEKGTYENETYFSEVPQWHYYDQFGNKLLDGFYMYGLSKSRNDLETGGMDNIALHPLLLRWLNGVLQAGDIQENGGVLAMIGDRINSKFTPFSFKQTLFAGARFDVFYKKSSLSFLTNRISNTGEYGAIVDFATKTDNADWLTGVHAAQKFGDILDIGGTYANIHHEESKEFSNPYRGVDYDTSVTKTPTGLSLYGLNGEINLKKVQAYGEYLRSQEFHDGKAKEKGGNVLALNGHWDIFDKLRLGGEFYTIGSRFQTNFSCPVHPEDPPKLLSGSMGKYQYSLVEDNDDKDEFPENGRSRYNLFTKNPRQGDPDGTIPEDYDKDKNGVWDYEEDFLNYDADPIESKILFDRNNNGIPDETEDDAYPDYPYVPGYYLPGERYYRYDKTDDKWENKTADSLTHKGLAGLHLYTRLTLLQYLELTVGGIYDRSQEKTFQMTYKDGVPLVEKFADENAINLYFLAHYKKPIERDKYVVVDNFFRLIKDNIPNHTQDFVIKSDLEGEYAEYNTVIDNLDYRDMFADALRAEFTIFKNRGFNFTAAGKYEFQKHFPHLEFNYKDKTISSFILIDKLAYIFSFPFLDDISFLKDLFIIPKYKNIYQLKSYSPRESLPDAMLDAKYRCSNMSNTPALVLEWKITEKSALTLGGQLKRFDDFLDAKENYWEPCYRLQFMIKDRYSGMAVVLTTGFTQYAYRYDVKNWNNEPLYHNPFNNPHGATANINNREFFINVYCGI